MFEICSFVALPGASAYLAHGNHTLLSEIRPYIRLVLANTEQKWCMCFILTCVKNGLCLKSRQCFPLQMPLPLPQQWRMLPAPDGTATRWGRHLQRPGCLRNLVDQNSSSLTSAWTGCVIWARNGSRNRHYLQQATQVWGFIWHCSIQGCCKCLLFFF